MSSTGDDLAPLSNTGVDVSRADPSTPIVPVSPASFARSADITAVTTGNIIPEAEPTITGKKHDEKGSRRGKITVAVVEKALHAAKLVVDNFSIPGAGTAVEGILKVITIVKVRVSEFRAIGD